MAMPDFTSKQFYPKVFFRHGLLEAQGLDTKVERGEAGGPLPGTR